MGLLKAGVGALGGVLADQWREFFYCDSLAPNVLAAKGEKKVGGRSSNKKGEDNVISNGAVISVNEGQCMMIVESGKIVEICAEAGEFVYDTSTEPSIFYGGLGAGIKKSFSEIGKRFTFGGDVGKDQRVYYFNTKEIHGNKFGTPAPIPFQVIVNEALGYKLSVDLRCNGVYSYRIADPMLFYSNVCGNVANTFERDEIDETLKGELLHALQPALAKISARKIGYSEIPLHTKEVGEALREELAVQWSEQRGLVMQTISFNAITVPDAQREKITEWEEVAMGTNPLTAASRLAGAQAEAMVDAANNQGGMGAMGAFMGMNMVQGTGGVNAQTLFAMGERRQSG